jgi:hypothetical protein
VLPEVGQEGRVFVCFGFTFLLSFFLSFLGVELEVELRGYLSHAPSPFCVGHLFIFGDTGP